MGPKPTTKTARNSQRFQAVAEASGRAQIFTVQKTLLLLSNRHEAKSSLRRRQHEKRWLTTAAAGRGAGGSANAGSGGGAGAKAGGGAGASDMSRGMKFSTRRE